MQKDFESSIEKQRQQVFENDGKVVLSSACSLDDGIISIENLNKKKALSEFHENSDSISFFIPASGSGSRMFQFLFEFIKTNKETSAVKSFFNSIENLAFYHLLPENVKGMVGKDNLKVAEYILHASGLNFSGKLKGLIPFHQWNNKALNPFQEQVLQADTFIENSSNAIKIEFSIQKSQEDEIILTIEDIKPELKNTIPISYSVQSVESNAYCFDEKQQLMKIDGELLRRPAGHGALLQNLNAIDSDIVLIKNIDNIQPMNAFHNSSEAWKISIGYLKMFQKAISQLMHSFSIEGLNKLNEEFQFLSAHQVEAMTRESFQDIVNRPTRVCGMVKNEGKAGGGPFWIKDGDSISKHIIEGVQISDDANQQEIMNESSHFNPVFIALSKNKLNGDYFDLSHFIDESKFIKVKKPHQGETIFYRELPGLWNGSMHNWNTIFIEMPKTIFTPVKSALDLI